MERCKNCKYFQEITGEWTRKHYKNKYGECNCEKFEYKDDYDYNKRQEIDKLLYYDYESYCAGFYVGEDFGCIHFEERRGRI